MIGVLQILVSARALRPVALAGALALLAGCGQRGPLYLPTGDAARGRASLPEVLTPEAITPARSAASGLPPTGTANPVRTP